METVHVITSFQPRTLRGPRCLSLKVAFLVLMKVYSL